MLKKFLLLKKFNKLSLSVNARIGSFFDNLKVLINSKKKVKINLANIDRKILIITGSVIALFLTYFLIPSIYDEDLVKIKLENQISEKYNLEVKLEGSLSYNLFPKPHFFIKDIIIIHYDKNLGKSDFTKIYIEINNFFSLKNLKIKNLLFKQTEFDISSKNSDFFKKVLNSNSSDHYINFKNSKLFFKDLSEDVIFLTNIKKLNFLYNDEFNQELNASLEIFNIPLKIKIVNDLQNKNAFIKIDVHKLRLNIENNLDYSEKNIIGLMNFKIINKLKKINYIINKNSLNFNVDANNFKGKIDFKPFYLSSDLKLYQIDIAKILDDNSIFLDLLNSEILNNQSLNAEINIDFDSIRNVNYLRDIALKIYFEQGNIVIKNSTLNWKNSILINVDNTQLISENNKIIFAGSASFNFNDIDEFYKQYQVKKTYRKKIEKIKLDFFFNVNENKIEFDNLKIDGDSNINLDNFINDFNSKRINIFNKVLFRNSIKDLFSNF
tara:strand:+ start:865 stop:2349 length:1485 start_codon:yes stop_codon:yes gene_type:complete